MFATDFLFNNLRASDLGLMICSFDSSPEPASGGEIEYNVVKTPGRDRFTFYGSQFNSALEWNFSICKDPDLNCSPAFTQYEESRIAKWLLRSDGYKPLQFLQEGYENIFYNVCFRIMPHQIAGETVGFDLTATSDCAYGFSELIKKTAVIKEGAPLELFLHSDVDTYILPRVKVTGKGNFYISNDNDILQNVSLQKETLFRNMPTDAEWKIIMDSDTDTILSVNSETNQTAPLSNPNQFNWYFLRLVGGRNILSTNSKLDVTIELQYREPRFVIL